MTLRTVSRLFPHYLPYDPRHEPEVSGEVREVEETGKEGPQDMIHLLVIRVFYPHFVAVGHR